MGDKEFMAKPCEHCPFRIDVRPFLTVERAEELAYNASNPYGTLPCHKTLDYDNDSEEGEGYYTNITKECAGHLSMKHRKNGSCGYEDDGFSPSENCYSDPYEMVESYENEVDGEWEKPRRFVEAQEQE